jgi:hypothetical protein
MLPAMAQMTIPDARDFTTVTGAAKILGAPRSTVYDLVKRGALTLHKLYFSDTAVLVVGEVIEIKLARERVAGRG